MVAMLELGATAATTRCRTEAAVTETTTKLAARVILRHMVKFKLRLFPSTTTSTPSRFLFGFQDNHSFLEVHGHGRLADLFAEALRAS